MDLRSDELARSLPPHLSIGAGLLMGGADAIPGVSGGTIALIIGIYERFINSLGVAIKTPLLVRSADGRKLLGRAFGFLIPLGIGIVIAYYLATKVLVGPKDEPGLMRRPDTGPICYAFFFGLVLVSVREPFRRIKARRATHFVAAAVAAVAGAIFVGLPAAGGAPPNWALVLGGAGAISMMLLPGVSGSLFLVIVGQYNAVAGAIHDRDMTLIVLFLGGIALGMVTFIPLLRYLLRTHHDLTMAALTGMMAGSLRALWPYKDNYDPVGGQMNNTGIGDSLLYVILALVAGGAVVWLLARLERRLTRDN